MEKSEAGDINFDCADRDVGRACAALFELSKGEPPTCAVQTWEPAGGAGPI